MDVKGKKILYLITQSHYGGAQKYVLQLAKHFSADNEVRVAIGEKQHLDLSFIREAHSLGIEPIVISNLTRSVSLIKAFEALMEIRKLLYKVRPDIVHINSSMAGAIGSCAAWLYNLDPLNKPIRVAYTAHGFVFNEPMSEWLKKFYIFIEKISAQWKHRIITVSEFDKKQAMRHAITYKRKLRTIHNGIDPASISLLSRADAQAQLNISHPTRFVVGTIASLYPTKGLSSLIQAAALLQDPADKLSVLFIIIGDGPEKVSLSKQITDNKLEATVYLAGQIANASTLLKAFDLFVLPSVKEGLPYCLLEAGIARVPIVATRVGGVPEIIDDGKTGMLVTPQRPPELAEAIRNTLANTQQAQRYANELYEKIQHDYSLSEMLKSTSLVYQELTAPAKKT